MGKNFYIKEKKLKKANFTSTDKRINIFKIILLVSFISAVVLFSIFGVIRFSEKSVIKKYNQFQIFCEENNYKEALKIYRNLYEKSKGTSLFSINPEQRDEILEKIENEINDKIENIFIKISERSERLTQNDINLIEGFEEISVRKLTEDFIDYLTKMLYGTKNLEQAQFLIKEINRIDLNLSTVYLYESELENISNFSGNMKKLTEYYENEKYLETAELVSIYLEDGNGFIGDFLKKYLFDLTSEMYLFLTNDIEDMMSRHKYYTSKSIIERMLLFYPDDEKLKGLYEICNKNTAPDLVPYNFPVEHLSVRPLLSDESYTLGADGHSINAEDLLITSEEFRKVLEELYENDYILINADNLITPEGTRNPLFIPSGKKPLIFSIEGLNYYVSRQRSGNSINLSVDEKGNILSTYKNKDGIFITDGNGEAVGILDQFVDENPDFSFDGAKGIISLTGYECIYGYVVNDDQAYNRNLAYAEHLDGSFTITDEEIRKNVLNVNKISEALKRNGWIFASSTYNNYPVANNSLEYLIEDTVKWKQQIEIHTGNSKIFLFPHGSSVFSGDERTRYLIEQGFKIQSGIGPTAYFLYGESYLFMDRVFLNGYTMRTSNISRFFDVDKVYSQRRSKAR